MGLEAKKPWENIDLGIQEKIRRERQEQERKRPRAQLPVYEEPPRSEEDEEGRRDEYKPNREITRIEFGGKK